MNRNHSSATLVFLLAVSIAAARATGASDAATTTTPLVAGDRVARRHPGKVARFAQCEGSEKSTSLSSRAKSSPITLSDHDTGLTNADSFESLSVSDQDRFTFAFTALSRAPISTSIRLRIAPALTRQWSDSGDKNFLYWGADERLTSLPATTSRSSQAFRTRQSESC